LRSSRPRNAVSTRCRKIVADLVEVALRELANVLAVVTVFGKCDVLAEDLLRAGAHRQRKVLDLRARIVVIELARHVGALPLDQSRDGVAERGLATMTDVQRTCRICRDELDHHALTVARGAAAVVVSVGKYLRNHRLTCGGRDENVDESGAGNLDPLDECVRRKRRNERLREFARLASQRLRMLERDVRREIAVLRLLRRVEVDREMRALGSDRGDTDREVLLESGAQIGHWEVVTPRRQRVKRRSDREL
jgi:hypothetical protein